MSGSEAQAEAKRRWGVIGSAWLLRTPSWSPEKYVVCGAELMPNNRLPYGFGDCWEEAFAHVDVRATLPPRPGSSVT